MTVPRIRVRFDKTMNDDSVSLEIDAVRADLARQAVVLREGMTIRLYEPSPSGLVETTGVVSYWAEWGWSVVLPEDVRRKLYPEPPWPPTSDMRGGDLSRRLMIRLREELRFQGVRSTGWTGTHWEVGIWPWTAARAAAVRAASEPLDVTVVPNQSRPRWR